MLNSAEHYLPMILDMPTSDDFRNHGIDYLNLGWGHVLEIIKSIRGANKIHDPDEIEAMEIGFWGAAERELGTALSLIQQGAEFLLKSEICRVSPWLLLTRNPAEWPRGCSTNDTKFAAFRTIDAQDLIKVHDTFCARRLPQEFRDSFDHLRQRRNCVIHTVDPTMKLTAEELIENVLIISEHMLGKQIWLRQRLEYLERDRHTAVAMFGDMEYRLIKEFLHLVDLLKPATLTRHFNFNKKKRTYRCPDCGCIDSRNNWKTAQLASNKSDSTILYCFICGQKFDVIRRACTHSDCKGNVFGTDYQDCLTCGRISG